MTSYAARPGGVPLAELIALLDLEEFGSDRFRGAHTAMSATLDHVFGGLVMAQALVAAGRTVAPERAPHSLHAHFLRAGDHREPMTLHVRRTRDGGSLSHRRVVVEQHARAIAELTLSFALEMPGPEHQAAMPAAPAPETLPPDHEMLGESAHPAARAIDAFELRTVGLTSETGQEHLRLWLRAAGPAPEDPLLHAALFAYASDLRILEPILRRHGGSLLRRPDPSWVGTTLDHTVWFHSPVRVDDWLLLVADSPAARSGRGLARGSAYDSAGLLVAGVAQEALLRSR